ncbi:MAG: (2Fe-2S)-binding protein [Hyphomonadaceae bacterium]|nr:(2Fe-2S)-binding protein [Hyphomonadaceae bacterium]
MARLKVNGRVRDVEVSGDTPLLWALREQLELTGAKYGCGIAACGACTVHVDGEAIRSCVLPVSSLTEANEITTIEGLSRSGDHPVQQAWAELDVPQCGYCQPGMIMAVAALLKSTPNATDADIDSSITNICRCGTFARVRKGVHLAKTKS